MIAERVPAVGGTRTVPAPDAIARDYILLALRLDQHAPGTVDGFYGPADLKARVDMEQRRSPTSLADDAVSLRARLDAEIAEPDRRHWLDLQLVALETQARVLAGASLPYAEHVRRCFACDPVRRPESRFAAATAELDARIPGTGALADRLGGRGAPPALGLGRSGAGAHGAVRAPPSGVTDTPGHRGRDRFEAARYDALTLRGGGGGACDRPHGLYRARQAPTTAATTTLSPASAP